MASRYDPEFDRLVMAAPIVDNAGHLTVIGELEGDRCPCGNQIAGDVNRCDDCTECPTCQGDGCDWHLSSTNGAIEIDRACPDCAGTGRTP